MFPRYFLLSLLAVLSSLCSMGAVKVDGTKYQVITVTPDASTGLNELLVVFNTQGTSLSYTSENGSVVKWQKFSNLGGAYAEPVADVVQSGNVSSITASIEDAGYIIEDNDRFYYIWVVNYANHYMSAENLAVGPESDCSMAQLLFEGDASPIYYYTINGRQAQLSRDIEIAYNTLKWDDGSQSYRMESVYQTLQSITGGSFHVPAPLCNTVFTLTGDRFLNTWQMPETVTSNSLTAKAVEASTTATQAQRDVANEKKTDGADDKLGGSAPCEITFTANVTDAVVFTEWQFSKTTDFDDITLRLNDLDVEYTFREQGNTYVRFVCADASGECEFYSDTYTISVGESALECPNAFSPGASEGVNDEWRVSYKSIIEFECHIFNRAGLKMATLTDPSQGWDGKYNGKLVPAGVYFYVIKARGADGKQYKLSGDINIINFK